MLRPIEKADMSQLRQWGAEAKLSEFFRRFPPVWAWPDDSMLCSWFANSYIYGEEAPEGVIFLGNHDMHSKKVELGLIATGNCKRGLESTRMVADYVFNYLGYNKMYCLILPHRRDIALLLGMQGFKKDGVLPENLFWNGRFHDELSFSLLRKDF